MHKLINHFHFSLQSRVREEGRGATAQHGPVPPNPPRAFQSEPRYLNRFDSPHMAGLFTPVSTKPTNHSKFTSKCGLPRCMSCHESPVQKSKNKTKGMQKLQLVTWRVADAKPGLKVCGFSATELLDQMDGEYVTEAYEMSCEIGSLAVDIKDHDEDKSENKGYADEESDDLCDAEFVWGDWVGYEYEDWCFVEETL